MNLVINEWLLEYFLPGTPAQSRAQLLAFFDKIQLNEQKMIIGRETPFTKKYYCYMKLYGMNMQFKKNYVMLNGLLFQDTQRTIIVERHETKSVPDEDMSGVHNDDRYLLELVSTVPESLIISTDTRLIESLSARNKYAIIHLNDYLLDCP